MEIQYLFPVAVGRDTLGRELTTQELNCVLELPTRANIGNTISVNDYILELPELAALKKDLLHSVNKYFKTTLSPAEGVELYITHSWLNITSNTQYHHEHIHSNSYISGVFYVSSEGEVDKISFVTPHNPYILHVNSTDWNIANSKYWWLPVTKGDIVMFPSTITHHVPTPKSNNLRISIAFNTFLRGSFGDEANKTKLNLT